MHSFIDYAVKLGYTVDAAETALTRLGQDALTNDLLTVLISLTSATTARKCDLTRKRNVLPKPKLRCIGYSKESLSYVSHGMS